MIRNLKTLGLALVAVFALGAALASVSSASVLTSDGPVTMTGTELGTPGEENFFQAFGLKMKCPGSTGTAHKYNVTPHELIPSGTSTFTLSVNIKETQANGTANCTVAGLPATFDSNGCDLVLHLGVAGAATADHVCPPEIDTTLTVFFNHTDHTNNQPFCVFHANPAENQGVGGTATVSNSSGDLEVSGAFEGIHLVVTDLGTHPLLCPGPSGGSETTKIAKQAFHLTLKGTNAGGTATEVSVS